MAPRARAASGRGPARRAPKGEPALTAPPFRARGARISTAGALPVVSNRKGTRCRRDDEGLHVVHPHGAERPLGTLHHDLVPLHQVEHGDGAHRVKKGAPFPAQPCSAGSPGARAREGPSPPRAPRRRASSTSRARLTRFSRTPSRGAVQRMTSRPCARCTGRGRPSRPVRPPVPELEREDVGRGADLEDHRVCPGAVHRSRGDEEVVVAARRNAVDVARGVEVRAARVGALQGTRQPPPGPRPRKDPGRRRHPRPHPGCSSSRPACRPCQRRGGYSPWWGAPAARGSASPMVSKRSKRMGNSAP